jgi:hypothetical protein
LSCFDSVEAHFVGASGNPSRPAWGSQLGTAQSGYPLNATESPP